MAGTGPGEHKSVFASDEPGCLSDGLTQFGVEQTRPILSLSLSLVGRTRVLHNVQHLGYDIAGTSRPITSAVWRLAGHFKKACLVTVPLSTQVHWVSVRSTSLFL